MQHDQSSLRRHETADYDMSCCSHELAPSENVVFNESLSYLSLTR